MTREAFQALVREALDLIPRRFQERIRNVAVVVEDAPAPDLLRSMDIEPPDTLLGLYQGTPLPDRSWGHGNALPDRIAIYQRPIEEEAEGDEDEVVAIIGETLIHEFGHYFGLSEEEIEDIEDRYWRGDPYPGEEDDEDAAGKPEGDPQ